MPCDPSRLFSGLYCGIIALQTGIHFREQLLFFRSDPQRLYGPPALLLGLIPLPRVSERVFLVSGLAMIICLATASAGFAPRVSMAMALPFLLLYFPSILPLGYIGRKANLIPVVLTALVVSPAHSLLVVRIAVAMVYFSAGIEKLRATGFRWADGKTLQGYLLRHFLFSGNIRALWLSQRNALCMALSTIVLTWELTFWTAVVYPQVTWFYLPAGILFHAGTSLTMRVHYWIYFGPAYLAFVTPWLCAQF